MTKPSLIDFMTLEAPAPKAERPAPQRGEDVVNLTLRMKRSQWEHLIALTTAERTKIQPYLMQLIGEDFQRRGLRL